MSSFVPRDAETLAERARYTSDGLTTVSCLDCLVSVEVRKNSDHQTEAQRQCPVLSGRDSIHEGCSRLSASIEAAVREGRLPVGVAE